MAIRERLIYAIDYVTDGAQSGLKKLKADIDSADGAIGKMKATWRSASDAFAQSGAAQAALFGAWLGFTKKAVADASNLEESINALKVVYGEAGDEVLKIGESSVESFGLSQRAFNEMAVQFAAFAETVAQRDGRRVSDVVAEMSTRVADFASVMNIDVAEASRVFMSTLAGEAEPLRRYGRNVSAAAVEHFLLSEGIVESKDAITDADKVLGRYGLLMSETADTAGDFSNTQGSLANQTKTLKANMENLSAAIGDSLLPALSDGAQGINDFIETAKGIPGAGGLFSRLTKDFGPVGQQAFGLARAYEAIGEKADDLIDKLPGVGKSTGDTAEAMGAAAVSGALVAGALDSIAEGSRTVERENKDHYRSLKDLNRAYDDVDGAVEQTTDSLEDQTRAMERQRRVTDQLYSATLQLVGGDIAVREAQRQAAQAMDEFNQSTDRTDDVVDQATEAQLRAASAAADYRVQQLEASGANVTAQQRANILRAELQNLAGNLDGPVRDALLRYIDELNRIPSVIDTQLRLRVTGANVTLGGQPINGGRYIPGADVPRFDSGGIIPGPIGSPQLVVAHGGETVLPTHKKPTTGGVTLNVYAGIGTDGAQVGRQIVQALENFYRSGGRPPRSA